MRWCVIQHAEHGGAVIAEPALAHYEAKGWQKTSEWAGDWSDLNLANHPLPQQEPAAAPAKTEKGKS